MSTPGGALERNSRGHMVAFAVAGLLLAALALRLFGIAREDLWFDEVLSMRSIESPNLATYLEEARRGSYPVPPLYFVTLWGWVHTFGFSVVAARMLSIAAGTIAVAALYATGRSLYGHRVGLLAGALMALHAYQADYAQEIRPYALAVCFAVLTMLCLARFAATKRFPWLAGNVVCGGLMFWMHPISGALFVAEALFLATAGSTGWKWLLAWAFGRTATALTLLPWVLGLEPNRVNRALAWMKPLDVEEARQVAFDWFGANAVAPTNALSQALAPMADNTALASIAVVLGLLLCWGVGPWLPLRFRARPDDEAFSQRRAQLFVALWLVAPLVIVAIYSVALRPAFYHRYLIVVLPAVYLAVASGVYAFQNRYARGVALALVCAAWGYQLVMAEPGPTRPPWSRLAADMVNAPAHGIAPGLYPVFLRPAASFYEPDVRERVEFLSDNEAMAKFVMSHIQAGTPVQLTVSAYPGFVNSFLSWLDYYNLPHQVVTYRAQRPVRVIYVVPPGYDLAELDLASWTRWRATPP